MLRAGAVEQPEADVTLDLGFIGLGVTTAQGLAVHIEPGFEEVEGEQQAAGFGRELGHGRILSLRRRASRVSAEACIKTATDTANHSPAPDDVCFAVHGEEIPAHPLKQARHTQRR